MSETHPKQTKKAMRKRQKRDFCNDCERYKAFCDGRRHRFNTNEYWVCEKCIADGRPEQDDESDQKSILQFINTGDSR